MPKCPLTSTNTGSTREIVGLMAAPSVLETGNISSQWLSFLPSQILIELELSQEVNSWQGLPVASKFIRYGLWEENRDGIFKLLRSPRIDSASLCSLAGRNGSPIPTPFLHCKKELAIFPSPAGMSLTKLSLGGKKLNYSRPGRVWSVTSRLGTGKRLTLFYSVLLATRDFSKIPAQITKLVAPHCPI